MGDTLDDELASLRARAYGAHADIHDDPEALTRLRRLEEQSRARGRLHVPPRPPMPTEPAASPPLPMITEPDVSAVASSAGSGPEPSSSRNLSQRAPRTPRARVITACLVCAAVGAAVAIPLTMWAVTDATRPYAVLHEIDGPTSATFFSPESHPQRYEDFLGIRVTSGGVDYQEGRCLLVELQPEREVDFEGGATRGYCAEAGFGAVVDVTAVDSYLAPEVREELGEIAGLRFEAVGDEVHVFVARVTPTPIPAIDS